MKSATFDVALAWQWNRTDICQAHLAFTNWSVLPECLRPPTEQVQLTWQGNPYTIRTCAACTGLFTIRPGLNATVTPLAETAPSK